MALVVGTRPEAIKLAPVARALFVRGAAPVVVLTGQHPALDLAGFGFPATPVLQLGCAGGDSPHAHAAAVAGALEPYLAGAGLVLVQGDTSSALGGALAARNVGVALAHVEAGLRSHDFGHPWPEEEFRIAIDQSADLLFAPTALSAANLRREQVQGQVHVTGNSGVDAALSRPVAAAQVRDGGAPRLLVTCHRRESWGEGLSGIAAALREIARQAPVRIRFILHPNPQVAGVMRALLEDVAGIDLQPPCDHRAMLQALVDSDLVLTDSGGLQEEAPLLGVPLLVLRERTERPEAIAEGNMELVGTGTGRIVAAVRRLLDDPLALARMSRPSRPFGDGRSAERIADVLIDWVALGKARRAA